MKRPFKVCWKACQTVGLRFIKSFPVTFLREMITPREVYLALLAASFALPPAFAAEDAARLQNSERISVGSSKSAIANTSTLSVIASSHKRARFGKEQASPQALHVANWVVDSSDNAGMPFMIVDKILARVLIFDADGSLQGAAPALLGLARGDNSTPGIG